MRISVLFLVLFGAIPAGAAESPSEPLRIVAAADLALAMQDVLQAWRQAGGGEVRLILGSSGHAFQQIRHGAPFDLFLSANRTYVERLGARVCRTAPYAIGRLVWFVPSGSPLSRDTSFEKLAGLLQAHPDWKIAIAHPEHAPYGLAARQALQHAGVWERLRKHLVYGESAVQAAQFAATASVVAALIPRSLVPELAGDYRPIAASMHAPLEQWMALLDCDNAKAARFFDFMRSERVRAILRRHGFSLPGRDS